MGNLNVSAVHHQRPKGRPSITAASSDQATACRSHKSITLATPICRLTALVVAFTLTATAVLAQVSQAASPMPVSAKRISTLDGTSSDAARRDAIRSIPLEKMSTEDRKKVASVLTNISLFRRMPVRVIDCDPDMYLFLVRHPDVVVNIWDVLKLSKLQLQQVGENRFHVEEPAGAAATVQFLYRSHDLHIVYGEGTYEGPILSRPVKGRGLLILKTGYVRETNDRYYVTSRLDALLSVEPVGADILTKTVSPLVGKTVDNNFVQTLAFLASLSRTAETNSRTVERLTTQLGHVQPEVRSQFTALVSQVAKKTVRDRDDDQRAAVARRLTDTANTDRQ